MRDDCIRRSVARLLGKPNGAVPHFLKKYGDRWEHHLAQWLERRGLALIRMNNKTRPSCLYLASGLGPRGYHHMIVMYGRQLAFDPDPSWGGVLKIDRVWLIAPVAIAQWKRD